MSTVEQRNTPSSNISRTLDNTAHVDDRVKVQEPNFYQGDHYGLQDGLPHKPMGWRGKQSNKFSPRCYTCGNPGHLARNCLSSNLVQRRQLNATQTRDHETDNDKNRLSHFPVSQITNHPQETLGSNASKEREISHTGQELEHANLHWTACYNDDCQIHKSSKEGSGWYPKKNKNKNKNKNKRSLGRKITVYSTQVAATGNVPCW